MFIHGLGVVAQAFYALRDLHEGTESRRAQDFALHHVAQAMRVEERLPNVRLELFHAQREAAVLRLNGQDLRLHLVAFLQHFRRMLHALGPAHVAHVDQAVDAVFHLDERAEVGQVAHPAFHRSAHRILGVQRLPRVRFQLLHAQRDAALGRVHVQDDRFYLLAALQHLRRMLRALGPAHLAHVHQAFNALFQLDERAVIGQAQHFALHVRAHGVALGGVQPRVRRELLEAQRDALLFLVELQYLHVDLIAHVHQVARMRQASPGHVGDVQQAVQPAQVHERAVLGQVLHRAGQDRTLFQVLHGLIALDRILFVQDLLAAHHHIAALLVQLHDPDFDLLPLVRVQVAHGLGIHLRSRQEGLHAVDLHVQSALDALGHVALHVGLVVEGLFDVVPDLGPGRLLVREQHIAFFALSALHHHFDRVAGLELDLALAVGHLRDRHQAVGLVADVYG